MESYIFPDDLGSLWTVILFRKNKANADFVGLFQNRAQRGSRYIFRNIHNLLIPLSEEV